MRTARRVLLALIASLALTQSLPQAQSGAPPILLVVNTAAPNPFGGYLAEILRAEGINAFSTVQVSSLTASALSAARLVVLAETPLTGGQATLLSNYVAGGGRLVAMRPDAQLEPALGVATVTSTSADRYLAINTGTATGSGFTSLTLPMVGPSQHYSLAPGAVAHATLYTGRTTATPYAAVVQYGRTATWAYDLARSVVYTRQGDPANAGAVRDGIPPVRTTSLFYGSIDLDRVGIPHADVHMRLFSRLIGDLLADVQPLPKLWYFPGSARTLVVPTGDTHVFNDAATQQQFASIEAHGGRLSLYLSRWVPYPDASQASALRTKGHEIGLHPYGAADGVTLDIAIQTNTNWFTTNGLGAPSRTTRMHQIEWPSWVGPAKSEAAAGIGMDTTFYTWGPAVTYADGHQAHGFINGSGLPMRFVDETGALVPVYQQVTSLIDEQLVVSSYSELLSVSAALGVSRQLIDDSQAGGYSAITTQFHTDYYTWAEVQPWAEGTLDYAVSLGVPIWTAERWLRFNEARAATAVGNVSWSAPTLTFTVSVPAGAEAQSVTLPALYAGLALSSLTVDGAGVTPVTHAISGRDTLFFNVPAGTHAVSATFNRVVPPVNHPPGAVGDTASVVQGSAATIAVLANDSDPDGDLLTVTSVTQGGRGSVTINPDFTVTYASGATCGADSFTYTIDDGRGGTSTGTVSVTITCTGGQVVHTSTLDFASCGVFAGTIPTTIGDGEVRLAGAFGDEYGGSTLNAALWTSGTWANGAYAPTLSSGILSIGDANGAYVRSAGTLPVTTIETTARFGASSLNHIGWGDLGLSGGHYLLFSTFNTTTNLYARSASGAAEQRTDLGPIPSGYHVYRIDRAAQTATTDLVSYYIDGVLKAQHAVATVPAMYVYASNSGGATPTLDIDRLWVYPAHVSNGTFQGCVIDAGGPVTWSAAVWSASMPSGTTVQVATRSSADGSTWSDWSAALTASGSAITSPAGRYLQYRLSLASTSAQATPVVDSVTVTYRLATDLTPPAINGVAVGSVSFSGATISWATDEPSTSQVQYGTTTAYGQATGLDPTFATTHAQALTGLAPSTLYHFRVLSRDVSGNQGTSADATFTTPAAPPDNPPVAVNDAAATVQGGQVTVAVLANDTDVDGDPLTVVSVTPGALGTASINPDGTVTYTAGATCAVDSFTYTITDGRGGTATATVTVSCSGGQFLHATAADFSACGTVNGTLVTAIGNGEVRLAGAFGDEYAAAGLDGARWTAGTWIGGAYTAAPSAGILSIADVNGAYVRSATALGVTTLEATARFSAAAWEHIGWGALDLSGPYLLFSTAGTTTNLYARSADPGGEQRTDLGPIPTGFHVYRIDRVAASAATDQISYYIDGVLRAQHTVATVPALYVYLSNNGGGALALDVDRTWVYPSYVASGTFTSCVLDAGSDVTWNAASWTATLVPGTTLSVSTRTSTDNATWSGWVPVAASGDAVASPAGRYLQYELSLSSGAPDATPALDSIAISFSTGPADTTPPSILGATANGVTATSAVVSWTTSEAATSQVLYGTTPAYGSASPLDSTLVTAHVQALAGLLPNTTYHYQVLSADAAGNAAASGDATFTTSSCTYALSPTSQAFTPAGGTGSVTVTAGTGCTWTATSSDAWLSVTSGTPGTGSGSVGYSVAANGATTSRAGTLTIGGQAVSVTQGGLPTLSVSDASVSEGNSGTTALVFTATLSAASTQTVTVNYATANGTAVAGSDYTAVTGALTFAPGALAQTISVPVAGDTVYESSETVLVNLTTPANAVLARTQAVGTIVNDDGLPSLSISDVGVTEGNAGSVNAAFAVTLSSASSLTTTVAYATADGTATAGTDYTARGPATLTFAPGVTTQTVTVPVLGDTLPEANETFVVNLSGATNATIAKAQGIGTIADNDGAVTVTAPNTAVSWPVGSVRQITWTHNLGAGSTMRLEVSRDGGATWELISASVVNAGATTGSYAWTVTGPTTTAARIRATWTARTTLGDISNVNFSITAPTISVATPNTTGTNWGYGTNRTVSWTTNLGTLDRVNVLMSTDGGATFPITLAADVPASPASTTITVPTLSAATTTARIRVQSTSIAGVQGTNPSNFQVQPAFVTVTNPNTQTVVWTIGTTVPVRWSQNLGALESVRVDLSLDGGATYPVVLLASATATSAPSVTVQAAWATTSARVRVTWLDNGSVTDISNANFTIR
jgi:hypothetical protein